MSTPRGNRLPVIASVAKQSPSRCELRSGLPRRCAPNKKPRPCPVVMARLGPGLAAIHVFFAWSFCPRVTRRGWPACVGHDDEAKPRLHSGPGRPGGRCRTRNDGRTHPVHLPPDCPGEHHDGSGHIAERRVKVDRNRSGWRVPMSSGEAVGMLRRRDALSLAGAAALAGIRPARADTKLTIWTGYPEIQPVYQAVAAEYAKTRPGISFDFFSTSLREAEQKLTAAVPTGTGPDIFDIGSNISVNFIDNGLIEPNPPDIDAHLKSGLWGKFTVEFFTLDGKTYGLPFLEGSRASMYLEQDLFPAGRTVGAAGDLPRTDRGGEEAGADRQSGPDDAQRHQSAAVGPGQRDRREVPLRPGSSRRFVDRAHGCRQMAQRLRQSGRPRCTGLLCRRRADLAHR